MEQTQLVTDTRELAAERLMATTNGLRVAQSCGECCPCLDGEDDSGPDSVASKASSSISSTVKACCPNPLQVWRGNFCRQKFSRHTCEASRSPGLQLQ